MAHIDVRDSEGFGDYTPLSMKAVTVYGARFLVHGGSTETVEGALRARHVILEFPTYEAALECYRSQEYEDARAVRQAHADADIIIVEGVES